MQLNPSELKPNLIQSNQTVVPGRSANFKGCGTSSCLSQGAKLNAGDTLVSNNGRFTAKMQSDGNFVVRDAKVAAWLDPVWSTRSSGRNSITMQTDGNLVISDRKNRPVWNSGTKNKGGKQLELWDNGNLAITDANSKIVWSTIPDLN